MTATPQPDVLFWTALGRAFGGSLIFSFPLLMTMEMWWLGFYLDRLKIALFVIVLLPVLVGLSYYSGFRETVDWRENCVDALVALFVGVAMSAFFLALLGVLRLDMHVDVLLGQTILLSVPASIGAVIASKQLGQPDENEEQLRRASYGGELFIMGAGALLLAFNVAPTEEMVLIAYKMSAWHALLLLLVTLLIMHGIVYSVGFRGQEPAPEGVSRWHLPLRFTVVGYAIALLVSAYVLWTFGRFDGVDVNALVMVTVVLAFPAGVGAAASRLVI